MHHFRFAASVSVLALGFAISPAAAQSGVQPAIDTVATPFLEDNAGNQPSSQGDADIVVTGSRIARRDATSESPIVTIGQAEIATAGSPTLESALTQLPQLSTSAGASSSYRGRGGQASADLRGLGQQRTLVLIDGHRVQPASPDGSIDLNVIPSALVESVETITGGASATYGSDAVTGVINIKLRKNISGLELNTQNTISDRGDAASRQFGAALGGKFGDGRGRAMLSFDYSERDPTAYTERGYLANQALSNRLLHPVVNLNAANLPSQTTLDLVFAKYGITPGTVVRGSALLSANSDGSLFTQNGAINYRDIGRTSEQLASGSVYNSVGNAFVLQTKLKRYNAFGRVDYDLTSNVNAFAQFLFTDYTVNLPQTNLVYGAGTQTVAMSASNPFIPADLAQVLASRPNRMAPFTVARGVPELGVVTEKDHYATYQFTGGLSGRLRGGDWRWDFYASYGSTRLDATNLNYISLSGIKNLLGSSTGGTEYCAGGYNPFSLAPMSPACMNYLRRNPVNTTTLDQTVIEGNINGTVARLPAGDLSIALGADYRRNGYRYDVDPSITSNEVAYYFPISGSSGATSVVELYGEALIPILREVPGLKELNLDLGYRFSKYDLSGTTHTYKASLDWTVVPNVRLRGGYARAVRAPSAGELFAGAVQSSSALGTIGLIGAGDPCDFRSAYRGSSTNVAQVVSLCQSQGVPSSIIGNFTNLAGTTPYLQIGNRALKPEVADTYSAGIVLRSPFSNPLLSDFTLSVDAYYISLRGAIGYIPSVTALQKCFNADGSNAAYSQSNYYCSLIARDAGSGQLTLVQNPLLNLGGYKTDGIDFAIDWKFGLGAVGLRDSWGKLGLSSTVNYLNSFKIQTLPGGAFQEYAGTLGNTQIDVFATAHPNWKATTTLRYSVDQIGMSLKWRFLDSMKNASNVGTNGNAPRIASVSYFDAILDAKVGKKFSIQAGILNFTDLAPPRVNTTNIGVIYTDVATYDLVGRRFFVGTSLKF